MRHSGVAEVRNLVYNSGMRKVRNSRARVALEEYFAKNKGTTTQMAVAKRLGVKQALISQWISGKARPSARLREMLEVTCGIPAHHWLDASESAQLERLARAS